PDHPGTERPEGGDAGRPVRARSPLTDGGHRRIASVRDDAPVVEPGDAELAGWHRRFAIELFNRSWDLLERTDRSSDDDAEMLAAAFGSAFHWAQVGTAENRALGDHQIAKVASHVGQPAMALHYARRT